VVKPSQRREMAQQAVHSGRVSIKQACLVFGVSVTCYRYQPRLSSENAEIADHLIRLTHNQRNWGWLWMTGLAISWVCSERSLAKPAGCNFMGESWRDPRLWWSLSDPT
jgi:hypothetical protein